MRVNSVFSFSILTAIIIIDLLNCCSAVSRLLFCTAFTNASSASSRLGSSSICSLTLSLFNQLMPLNSSIMSLSLTSSGSAAPLGCPTGMGSISASSFCSSICSSSPFTSRYWSKSTACNSPSVKSSPRSIGSL